MDRSTTSCLLQGDEAQIYTKQNEKKKKGAKEKGKIST
jgi:hypothetical protein